MKRPKLAPPVIATPEGLLVWALQKIPTQGKFVLGGVVVLAAAALIIGWVRQYSLGLTFSVAVMILVFGVVTSAVSIAGKSQLTGVGGFLAWSLAILFVALLVLLLTSAFFGVPPAGARLVARMLGSQEILTSLPSTAKPVSIAAGQVVSFSELPENIRTEPASTDPNRRVQELSALPEVTVKGTIQLASVGEKRVLFASTLRLLDGGAILTNGGDVTIEVNNLIADNGVVRAFAQPDVASPNAAGRNAGRVTLVVHGAISGGLSVDLRGQRGSDGLPGIAGGKGPKGARGSNASSGLLDCSRGAGRGGQGGQGQAGSDGGPGFAGGNGGVFVIRTHNVDAVRRLVGTPQLAGGAGGNGGQFGPGGPGGDGGDGGSPVGLCSGGGPAGSEGVRGANGAVGKPGQSGESGSFLPEQIVGS